MESAGLATLKASVGVRRRFADIVHIPVGRDILAILETKGWLQLTKSPGGVVVLRFRTPAFERFLSRDIAAAPGLCPHCLKPIFSRDHITVDLNANRVQWQDVEWEVQPKPAEILFVLAERWGVFIHWEVMAQRVWGWRVADLDNPRAALHQHISALRRQTLGAPFEIKNRVSRGWAAIPKDLPELRPCLIPMDIMGAVD